jgi:UDP-2,3-diacylglucosamine pyrophosphatase LpxH
MYVKVEALFISDVHLGSKGCNAEQVLETLKRYEPEHLFLVGDIVDGWLLKRRFYWPQSHTNVLRKILSYSKKGTKVIYVPGNHDEFLRQYDDLHFGNIEVHEEYVWNGALITHGDLYDGVVKLKWLGVLGSLGYDAAIVVDRGLKGLGVKTSLSKYLKERVKEAVKFVTDFESELARQARQRGCHTVVCGHIHQPEDKTVEGVRYLNTGDWIENNSYIVYDKGEWTVHK